MALKKTVITHHGFEAKDAYHRVEGVCLDSKIKISFQVNSYKSQESGVAFSNAALACDYDIEGANPIAQAYAHLKTLPEFAGATDC
jgi:hypothetical protein